jgi:phosphohistidine phosphatase
VRTLHLLRHAKSSWADPGQADRDRPLAPRGRRAARRVAALLEGRAVDLVLCSPAARTTETLALVRPALGDGTQVLVEEELYGAGARQLLARLRLLPERTSSVLVVGHNPGLQELVVLLARDGDLRQRAREHFPTAALATLAVRRGDWTALRPGGAELLSCVTPREAEREAAGG